MTIEALEKELKFGQLQSLYLLYGEELYLLESNLKRIKTLFGECVKGINFIMIDEQNVSEIISDIETPSFGYEKKLIIARNTGLFKKEGKRKIIRVMAKTIDIELQKQLDKPQAWFCKYFPARIRNVSEREIADRKLVFDFKDGRAYEEVAQRTAANMTERYGTSCTNIVFSPVPASTDKKNEIRYKAFCQRVCELTGAINGYDHVSVSGERLTIHENRKAEKEVRKVNVIEFDSAFFNGRSVVVFDDVITKGLSYATYANQLESLGANVLGGIFLARTHYKVK